jgi:hypothetical protein
MGVIKLSLHGYANLNFVDPPFLCTSVVLFVKDVRKRECPFFASTLVLRHLAGRSFSRSPGRRRVSRSYTPPQSPLHQRYSSFTIVRSLSLELADLSRTIKIVFLNKFAAWSLLSVSLD